MQSLNKRANKNNENRVGNSRLYSHKFDKKLLLLLFVVILLSVLSLFVGAYDITKEGGFRMFLITRIPRTLALMLTGSSMAICGLVMQILTQNRFVEPTTSGTIEWAGLGLVLAYAFIPSPTLVIRMIMAMIFSFIGTLSFFFILRKIRMKSSLVVPIVGIMFGAIISAVSTFFALQFDVMQSIEIWFQGSFAPIEKGRFELLFLIIFSTLLVYKMADKLTIAGLGKDISTSLGLNYEKTVLIGVACVSFTVGVVSSVVGNLPFLGLIIPNIVSMIRGDNLRENLPWVLLFGMATITACDIFARWVIMPFEVPVSLVLGTIGAFLFIAILVRKKR